MKMVMVSLVAFFSLLCLFLTLLPDAPAFVPVLIGLSGILAVASIVIAFEKSE